MKRKPKKVPTIISYRALAEQYPLRLEAKAKGKVALITIEGIIDGWDNTAKEFRAKVDALIADGITDVKLYINSPGGSVFEANEIANVIDRFSGKVTGEGGALVASAATYLALKCETFEMAENGQFMYHKPRAGTWGNENELASTLKLLRALTKQYRAMYAETTGMTEDEIEANWAPGDVWLTAEEALEEGFITGITKPVRITKDTEALFAACGAPTATATNDNEFSNNNSKTEMSNFKLNAAALAVLASHGLKDGENADEVNAAIAKLSATLDAEKTAHALEKGKREQLEKDVKAQREGELKAALDAAIADGKITAEERKDFEELAEANHTLAMKQIGKLTAKQTLSVTNTAGASAGAPKDLEEFQKLGVDAQLKFKNENPEAYAALFKQ